MHTMYILIIYRIYILRSIETRTVGPVVGPVGAIQTLRYVPISILQELAVSVLRSVYMPHQISAQLPTRRCILTAWCLVPAV